ncbi:probable cytochrome c oxidase subunit 5C-1 isoform X1 [Brassica napus]|uniref:probable cytochrome c oxidase subunit 5C-1 isoform X1 n=1 Tax=Brassica napus TaxID=3708 RepID=UPI0006AAD72B|nr:probable cytochrome c oxidase subunit 5C-1 isoform X1 [Brassica napus]
MTQVIGSSLFPISFVVVVLVHLSLSLIYSGDLCKVEMAGHKVAHATLKGPSVVKELVIGLALGLAAGGLWKMHHWNEQRKTRAFYDLLERGEISVVHPEE